MEITEAYIFGFIVFCLGLYTFIKGEVELFISSSEPSSKKFFKTKFIGKSARIIGLIICLFGLLLGDYIEGTDIIFTL